MRLFNHAIKAKHPLAADLRLLADDIIDPNSAGLADSLMIDERVARAREKRLKRDWPTGLPTPADIQAELNDRCAENVRKVPPRKCEFGLPCNRLNLVGAADLDGWALFRRFLCISDLANYSYASHALDANFLHPIEFKREYSDAVVAKLDSLTDSERRDWVGAYLRRIGDKVLEARREPDGETWWHPAWVRPFVAAASSWHDDDLPGELGRSGVMARAAQYWIELWYTRDDIESCGGRLAVPTILDGGHPAYFHPAPKRRGDALTEVTTGLSMNLLAPETRREEPAPELIFPCDATKWVSCWERAQCRIVKSPPDAGYDRYLHDVLALRNRHKALL